MLILVRNNKIIIGLLLTTIMAFTRGEHFASNNLPNASYAVFFLAGFYLSAKFLPVLLAQVALIDYISITWGGISDFCISPVYSLLLPAYATLWLAGRYYGKQYQFSWHTLLPLGLSVLVGTILCELLASGSFYFLSGRFVTTTLVEFYLRFIKYYPDQLGNVAFYLAIAVICHLAFTVVNPSFAQQTKTPIC